jgi:allantoin racemase
VLALEADPRQASELVVAEALKAERADDVAAVILGCAGMVEVFDDVKTALTVEAIDPVSCAARSMRWLAAT